MASKDCSAAGRFLALAILMTAAFLIGGCSTKDKKKIRSWEKLLEMTAAEVTQRVHWREVLRKKVDAEKLGLAWRTHKDIRAGLDKFPISQVKERLGPPDEAEKGYLAWYMGGLKLLVMKDYSGDFASSTSCWLCGIAAHLPPDDDTAGQGEERIWRKYREVCSRLGEISVKGLRQVLGPEYGMREKEGVTGLVWVLDHHRIVIWLNKQREYGAAAILGPVVYPIEPWVPY